MIRGSRGPVSRGSAKWDIISGLGTTARKYRPSISLVARFADLQVTVMVFVTGLAAVKLALPASVAVILHMPAIRK